MTAPHPVPTVSLHRGDCLEVMADLPAASFDAIVTDPPYHLTSIVKRFGAKGAAAAKHGTDGLFQRGSRGFMGQSWDGGDIAFQPETWAACLRVLKPGGHLVAFNHSKTFHHMALAIEAAGFEARDSILSAYAPGTAWAAFLDSLTADQMDALGRALAAGDGPSLAWLYGCGFPKSHDVAKGIEKMRLEDEAPTRAVCRFLRAAMDRAGLKSRDLVGHFGNCNPRLIDHWAARDTDSQPSLPTPDQWQTLKWLLDLPPDMDSEVARLNARKGKHSDTWDAAEIVGHHDKPAQAAVWREQYGDGSAAPASEIRQAGSPEAVAWEGWGTALKPAFEPIFLGRKPLSEKSVPRQHLATGTGGLNVDAARIPVRGEKLGGGMVSKGRPKVSDGWHRPWMDDAEVTKAKAMESAAKVALAEIKGRWPANVVTDGHPDTLGRFPVDADGSVARFFYSAKADAEDRGGSKHPTVKPQALMRWLVRLVTPRGGRVLDPFAGSGATGWAAWREGRTAELIEMTPEYQDHIAARIETLGRAPAPENTDDDTPTQESLF